MTIQRDERRLRYFDWIPDPNMSKEDRSKKVFLYALKDACKECRMCRLGMQEHTHNGNKIEDPHVFSNMQLSKFVVIGQNPGYNECLKDEPFVGQAGKTFNEEVAKHGILRDRFYLTNVIKCHTPENRAPLADEVSFCEPFIRMELQALRPHFVVTLGASAFGLMCPKEPYSENLGKIVKSDKFGVKVFPIYHPSGRNLSDVDRKRKFKKHIALLCAIIKELDDAATN